MPGVVEKASAPAQAAEHGYSISAALDKASANAWAAVLGGTIHGLLELPVVVPIEAAITQTQINAKSFAWNFSDLVKRREIYRSLGTTATGLIPKCWIHYAWLNFYIALLVPSGNLKEATKTQSAICGLATGGSEVLFLTPINFVKFRMQRPEWQYTSMLNCMSRVYKEEGIGAFWKGTSAVFMRNSICMLGMVGCYNTVEDSLPANWHFRALTAGALCGIIGSFFSYPFEMLRAARQHNIPFYEEIVSQGPKRMLAGYLPGAARIVMHSAALGILIPKMKEFSQGSAFLADTFKSAKAKVTGGEKKEA
jgi:hypothetical protein|eukprot:CAMPEP_0174279992 /NCGR_PEP_ID=MMETSP0809-20121228/277_1 /TAXON_ID=73025 ORGANISM="Eutreptiella gymnastica-like, Strain CCMP1594" /NCGR_SAMPLE_ID=MMETSP0809 /ASSEMBLY_ACC=CAM_ASM_000658 /LENGTH=308 /DNA_ID=CAMNT_0015372647 /DNA_START=36 /DNA_END=962 /DNA_ORIENTATION=+